MANFVSLADALVCSTWATPEQAKSIGTKYDAIPDDQLEDAILIASDVLFLLSGRVFPGTCEDTVRPCARRSSDHTAREWGRGDDLDGYSWPRSWGICNCGPLVGCTCRWRSRVELGHYPIIAVTSVKVDGVAVAAGQRWCEDSRWLVRRPDADGTERGWPTCQDLTLADTEPDTFSVSYTWGRTPPPGGQMAAAQFGGEIALDLSGSDECSLADAVSSITRQGVTLEAVVPSAELIDQLPPLGRAWVRSTNPKGVTRPPSVWWPDSRKVARVNT